MLIFVDGKSPGLQKKRYMTGPVPRAASYTCPQSFVSFFSPEGQSAPYHRFLVPKARPSIFWVQTPETLGACTFWVGFGWAAVSQRGLLSPQPRRQTTIIPQLYLPFGRPLLPSNRAHKALHRGTWGALGLRSWGGSHASHGQFLAVEAAVKLQTISHLSALVGHFKAKSPKLHA